MLTNAAEIFYTYRYAQFKNDPIEPWVIRQTGIYHQFNSLTKQNLWILINPMESSLAEQRLISCLNNHQTEIDQNPLWLHSVIHTSYFANWRRYLAAWEKILLPIVSRIPLDLTHQTAPENLTTPRPRPTQQPPPSSPKPCASTTKRSASCAPSRATSCPSRPSWRTSSTCSPSCRR